MTDAEQHAAAQAFAQDWHGRGYEKGETQVFWIGLLRSVFGVPEAEKFILFENRVELEHTSFIDARIPFTRVLIEQKNLSVSLDAKRKQSDGAMLTPMEQAQRYVLGLRLSEHPRFIVVCNFATFQIYDSETQKTELVQLADLPKEYHRLSFLVDSENPHLKREMELSIQAGEIVGRLYDAILQHYRDPAAPQTLKSLNALCVRLVFCLYAEDAGIFEKNQFHNYLARFDARDLRGALIDLFKVLDTEPQKRDPYLKDELAKFPYVNGGLFQDEFIEIPQLDQAIKDLLLAKASDDFDWSEISPTIFGAVFESTLNPETRRSGGMHYTSIENIHKVIDPLFLDALKAELNEIAALKIPGTRRKRLLAFQQKLAGLTFLDPACGSGNFLTETYLSLRNLENDILRLLNAEQIVMDLGDVIQVSIAQFYGIEINDFAVTVARTALWIAESQMIKATMQIVHRNLDYLPLKSYANIVEANALRIDWETVIPKAKLHYIMGNPPFAGYVFQTKEQKIDLQNIGTDLASSIDYVAGWYFKAAQLIHGTGIHTAFVSTNSITQGEQVASIWKPLYERFGIRIDFAYRTFRWDSEAKIKAMVHCVIVGFHSMAVTVSTSHAGILFDESGSPIPAKNINPYLVDAPAVFIERQGKPLCNVPQMCKGNQPTDKGNFLFSEAELTEFLRKQPDAKAYIRPFMGAEEFINNKKRYCLWLRGVSPAQIIKMSAVMERVENIRAFRLKSSKAGTRKKAQTPTLFDEIRQPLSGSYIIVPRHSSEKRVYIPMGFMSPDTIASDATLIIPDASLYHFGVLTSSVHMAWMRTVCGRLEMRYRYSKDVVYNNFPWPELTDAEKSKITASAQAILDARALYPDCSLADLYNEVTMPPELRKAHEANDRAVMRAYGFKKEMTEPEIVAELMKRYQQLTSPDQPLPTLEPSNSEAQEPSPKKRRGRPRKTTL